MDGVPGVLGVIPEGVEVRHIPGLLFHPGVVLEVVNALAVGVAQLQHTVGLEPQHVQVVVQGGLAEVIGAVEGAELVDAALVHGGGVCEDGDHHVLLREFVIFRHFYTAEHVGDAADAQPGQLFHQLRVQARPGAQVLLAGCGVEEAQEPLAVLVVDGDGHVGVLDVVDPGDVLVADALNAVSAEAVVQDGGALEGLAYGQLQAGIALLEEVPGAHGPGGAGGEAGPGEAVAGAFDGLEEVREGLAGDVVVPEGVAHLLELVEDHHGGVLPELPGLVENLLDVALTAGGGDDLPGDLAEPVEALPAHLRGEDGHAVAGEELAVERAAPAVVAGGGPDGVVAGGVELAGDQAGDQAAEGGPHLVAPGGEPLARHGEDAAGHAGEGGGDFHEVGHGLKEAAGLPGLVFPGDAEEIEGVHVPEAHMFQACLDFLRNGLRVFHLGEGGDDDAVFPGLLDVVPEALLVDCQVNLAHGGCPPVWNRYRNRGCISRCRRTWRPCRWTW